MRLRNQSKENSCFKILYMKKSRLVKTIGAIKMTMNMKSITAIALMSVLSSAYAGDFKQVIKLNITNGTKEVCFKTTDAFDPWHCGATAKNSYGHGPKNWFLGGTYHTFVGRDQALDLHPDSSCKPFFSRNRTREESGTLTISGTLVDSGSNVSVYDRYSLINCSQQWVKQ